MNTSQTSGGNILCPECRKEKSASEFSRWHIKCKACDHLEQARRWLRDNREKHLISSRIYLENNREKNHAAHNRWKKEHPDEVRASKRRSEATRRARKLGVGGTFTEEQWQSLCKLYCYRCLCCRDNVPLTVDHVIPLRKSETNDISNIQPLCIACNVKKNDKHIDYRMECT